MSGCAESQEIMRDFVELVRHVSKIPVWESKNITPGKKLGRERANERRRRKIRELSNSLKVALQERLKANQT